MVTTQPNRYKSYKSTASAVEYGANYRIERINVPEHSGSFISLIKTFRAFYSGAIKLTRKQNYDLVYASSSRLFTAFLGKKIAASKKTPLYLDIRDIFVDTIKDLYRDIKILQIPLVFVLKQIEKYTFSKTRHINLVSEGFKNYFTQYKHPEYSFFPNGIDDIFINAVLQPAEKKQPPEKVIILYAGNIGSGQGLEKIIPPIAKILGNKYLFRIIGDGGTRRLLEQAINDLNISNVEIHDPVSQDKLVDHYFSADYLFLHLNDFESFNNVIPSKIFEYAAFNKPIIAGVSGHIKNFISENLPDSIIFDPADVNGFIQKFLNHKITNHSHTDFTDKYARKKIMKQMAKNIIDSSIK